MTSKDVIRLSSRELPQQAGHRAAWRPCCGSSRRSRASSRSAARISAASGTPRWSARSPSDRERVRGVAEQQVAENAAPGRHRHRRRTARGSRGRFALVSDPGSSSPSRPGPRQKQPRRDSVTDARGTPARARTPSHKASSGSTSSRWTLGGHRDPVPGNVAGLPADRVLDDAADALAAAIPTPPDDFDPEKLGLIRGTPELAVPGEHALRVHGRSSTTSSAPCGTIMVFLGIVPLGSRRSATTSCRCRSARRTWRSRASTWRRTGRSWSAASSCWRASSHRAAHRSRAGPRTLRCPSSRRRPDLLADRHGDHHHLVALRRDQLHRHDAEHAREGLTMGRLPVFCWAQLVTAVLLLLAFPVLEAGRSCSFSIASPAPASTSRRT